MRWSTAFIPTLREAPADAEAASHRLLVRGGFVRQLHSGHYTLLPLGLRVHEKVADIVRREMDAIGAQEFHLPALHPAELWQRSGRWELMGEEMFRLRDRAERDLVLAMTHEEAMALLATELKSYKELPQSWYQIQYKFRDEPRPKSGLLRVREFAMKDSYSFDLDEAGLDRSFDLHHDAYVRIFERLGVEAWPVEASSGSMGGTASVEFMVASPAGEDDVARCTSPTCDYRANVERARAALPEVADEPGAAVAGGVADAPAAGALERFPTPGVRTIAALDEFPGGAAAHNQIKTMVTMADGAPTLALLRGDHQLNLQKLADHTAAADLRPADADEAFAALGAHPGSLGAVGVDGLRVVADEALRGRRNMTTGANEDDWHYRGVDIARDIAVESWADLREVAAGEPCIRCGAPLEVVRCIEVGHIFKLGRKYAEALGVSVLDPDGVARIPTMGSYGIGIGRAMAAVAEVCHDERGLVWPAAVAPFDVVISLLDPDDAALAAAAQKIAAELESGGADVLLDDRAARPGVKFADAELIGIPHRITVGARSMKEGRVEHLVRATGESGLLDVGEAAAAVGELVAQSR
ncbi:MAG TPA: proline--tRNA ligase [Acidimicrobiaceae bacterium]|nr:proline--tRNA ligase [Acidimicrobiaceae bacterium]